MISRLKYQFDLYNINPATDKLVAGVSGGLDSMALLYIIKQLKFDAVVVHINYKKRGVESDSDADLVARKAKEYGFDFQLFDYNEPSAKSGNFQDSARNFRRQKFKEVLVESNSNYILLAHHADDQIETVLQKILKGGGLSSITGMQVLEGKYFRPLLHTTRDEIKAFAQQNTIEWREDESNKDSVYARNWIRNEFSHILNHFYPGWETNISKHAQRLRGVNELLDFWLQENHTKSNCISLSGLANKSEHLQSLILHHWLEKQDIHVSEGVINQLIGLIQSNPGTKIGLNFGCEIYRNRESLDIIHHPFKSNTHPYVINRDDVDSKPLTILQSGINLVCEILKPDIANSINSFDISILSPAIPHNWMPNELSLDSNAMKFPLVLKAWDDGDKFTPLGMSTTKLVSDLLNDRKIDSSQKAAALKLTDFDGNICAIIFPHSTTKGHVGNICNDCKITDHTTSILNFKISYNYEH